jgi:hypothetical protein
MNVHTQSDLLFHKDARLHLHFLYMYVCALACLICMSHMGPSVRAFRLDPPLMRGRGHKTLHLIPSYGEFHAEGGELSVLRHMYDAENRAHRARHITPTTHATSHHIHHMSTLAHEAQGWTQGLDQGGGGAGGAEEQCQQGDVGVEAGLKLLSLPLPKNSIGSSIGTIMILYTIYCI